ncbi:MAG: hypothetical protein GF372_08020 [Candidatus Marinimicrobia bacterium]|nr:hypothetical protein [Candidatus Neomarinimicrobiota bacterium]
MNRPAGIFQNTVKLVFRDDEMIEPFTDKVLKPYPYSHLSRDIVGPMINSSGFRFV